MSRSDAEILWEAARVLNRRAVEVSPAAAGLPPLLFFTDPVRTPRPWETAARLPAGAGVVHRGFGRPEAADEASRLRDVTREAGVRLLIGLDAALAEAVGADGVHLPERALGQGAALRAAHPDWLITGAAHDEAALARCADLSAAVLSPVFPAGGESADRPALGVEAFTRLVATAPCPVYALGGVDGRKAQSLKGTGVCGMAGIGAVARVFAA